MGTGEPDRDRSGSESSRNLMGMSRRNLLRGSLGAVVAGSLVGCQSLIGSTDSSEAKPGGEKAESATDTEVVSETATPDDGSQDQERNIAFEDDWEDGDLSGWVSYNSGGDASAGIRSMTTPSGGSHVLRLSQSEGSGTELVFGTETEFAGWDGPWGVRTAFHTTALDAEEPYQKYDIIPAYDRATGDDPALAFRLGFRDGNGQVRPTRFYGPNVDSSGTDIRGWTEDQWYEVALSHDGNGGLAGTVWPTGSTRPASPTVEATISTPVTDAWPLAMHVNGNQYTDFQFSHSFISLSGGLERQDSI